jgi:hypothetical protein
VAAAKELDKATKQAALSLLAVCKAAMENDKQHRLLLRYQAKKSSKLRFTTTNRS